MIAAATLIAGGFGALLRYSVGVATLKKTARPLATPIVNIIGAAALGVLVGIGVSGDARTILGTGLLGGFTTFSTWMVEAVVIGERHHWLRATVDLAGVAAAGWGAYWLAAFM